MPGPSDSSYVQVPYTGREPQKQMLLHWAQHIAHHDTSHALYFQADGGMGKTWLLRSCPDILQNAVPNLLIARIVDFYNYESRTPDAIELNLIEGLKQTADRWYRLPADEIDTLFAEYRRVYAGYIRARERGGVSQGEYTPAKLRETFIKAWNQLAERHPLILRFDTVETLYSPPPPPEALISMASASTGVDMVLGWVADVVPHLKHTLALFSGRPLLYQEQDRNPFVERLQSLNLLAEPVQELLPFTDQATVKQYLKAYNIEVKEQDIPRIMDITEGRPLLLTCYAETRRSALLLPPPLPLPDVATARQGFEYELINTILNPMIYEETPTKATPAQITLVLCLHFLSYARRGIRRENLTTLFEKMGLEYDQRVIDELSHVALVKEALTDPAIDRTEGQVLLLHDEIHALIDQSDMASDLGYREPTLEYLASISKHQVQDTKHLVHSPALLKAMSDHLYYALTFDIASGYRFYVVYMDWLLNERSVNQALIISEAFWGILNYRVQRNGVEEHPYRTQLKQSPLSFEQIIHDEQVDQVQLLFARGQNNEAATLGETLYRQFVEQGVLPPEGQEITATCLPQDQYLFVELSNSWAQALHFSQKTIGSERIDNLFTRVTTLLEQDDLIKDDFLRLRCDYFLGYAYMRRGYMRRQQQRYADAIADYERGRNAFRRYRDEPVANHTSGLPAEQILNDHISKDLAQVTNNMAFALANTGNFKRALRLSDEVIKLFVSLSSEYYKALFYNTNGSIHIRAEDYKGAAESIAMAELLAQQSGVNRARALVSQARGQLERAKMTESGEPDVGIELHYEQAAEWLANEPDSLREVLYDWSGYVRDIAVLYRALNKTGEATRYEQRALDLLDTALATLPDGPSMQRADHLESKVVIYRIMGQYEQASALLDEAETIIRTIEIQEYGQVVCGKIALQRSLILLYRDKNYWETLRLMAIALARAYVFAKVHHDQTIFERIIKQHLRHIPAEELRRFKQETESEKLYVIADDLPYHKPDEQRWSDAWEDSIAYINEVIGERLTKYP